VFPVVSSAAERLGACYVRGTSEEVTIVRREAAPKRRYPDGGVEVVDERLNDGSRDRARRRAFVWMAPV